MNISKYENDRFAKIAEIIKTTPHKVDTVESVDSFKKKKTIAMMADYIDLYPKLFAMGFRSTAIMDELLATHGIELMTFRNFLAREGMTMGRLKQMAAWSYRKKMEVVKDYEKKIRDLVLQIDNEGDLPQYTEPLEKLQSELAEYKKLNRLD